jgi:hypothetical protein
VCVSLPDRDLILVQVDVHPADAPEHSAWLATYDDSCLDPAGHCARPALRLPVTGSSPTPSDRTNARTSASAPLAARRGVGPDEADIGVTEPRQVEAACAQG